MNFSKKNLAMVGFALVVFVVAEGLGVTGPPKAFVAAGAAKIKNFFQNLFAKKG